MTMEEFMQYGAPAGGGGTATAAPPKKMSAADFENYGAPTAEDYTAIYQGIKSNQPFGESPPDAYQRNIKLAADMDQGNRGAITGSAPYRVAEDIVSASASAIVNPLLSAENALGIDAAGDMLSQRQTQYDISHNRDMGYVQKTAGGIGESIAEYATLAAAGGGFGSALGLGKWGAKALKWATVGGGTGNKSYEDTYRSSINSGKTEDEAQKIALATAAVEVGVMAAFQKAGLGGAEGAIVDGLGIGAAKGSAKKLSLQGAKKFFTQTAGELAEEEITTFAQTMAQEGNPGGPKAYLDTAVQTLGTMGLLSGSQKLINFTTNPSRKNAKEAGLDELVTSQKERVELATKFNNGLTGAQFTEAIKASATSPEEADALLEIYRARAASAGESFDDYVGKRIKGVEKVRKEDATPLPGSRVRPDGRRGEIEFLQEGGVIIRAFETQTVATLAHETGHLFRRDLAGDDLKTAEQWAGAKDGKWDRKAEEKFARGFERYLAEGTAPTKSLENVFAKFKDWLSKVYSVISKSPINVDISPEMRTVFDRLLTPAETGQNPTSPSFVTEDEFASRAIPADEAKRLVQKIRAGDANSKNGGSVSGEPDTGPLVATNIPLDSFTPEYIQFLRESTDPERVKRYASEDVAAPVYALPPKENPGKFGRKNWIVSDGGHRLLAAIERGDTSIAALVPPNAYKALYKTNTQTQGETNGQVQTQGRPEGQVAPTANAEEPLQLGTFPPPSSDMLSQAPVTPDLAAKNASMDEARAAMGLPAINQPAAPGANMPHHIAEQEAIRQRIPERASGIVMDYLSDKRKEPLNQLETAGLAVYGDRLNEAYARLQEDVNNLTLDEGERMTKAAEMERIEQDFDLLSRAMRQSGTAQSLAFSQRKHVVGSDYRPLSVESRAAAAKGKKLTAREKQKLNKTAKEIKAADEKLEAQKQKEAAKVETTREKIKKTVKKLKEYVAKAKLPTDLNRYAQDLAKQYLAEGVTGRRELIDKVQKAVREIFPETQRRQVIDAISGYGDFKELSKDEASVRLRDLKGQLQQISKLKDMSEGKAPSKTGMERRDPSDTERALIKEVNEAKKEGGYEVTDPAKQLASALSTIKTRLRNQIKDLQAQIDSRQKLIKQKKAAPSDEETKRLTEERDALKTQFDDIFGKEGLTDAQRIANAERATKKSIEDLQKRLDAGDFSPRPQYAGNPVPESLAKLREKAAELRAQYNSSKPVSLDEKKRLEQSIARTEKSISELERRINQGDYSEAPKRPPASSDQLKALKDRAAELRAQYNSGKPVSLDEKKRLEKATLAAEKAVTELERRLKEGDFSTKPKRPPATNQNIQVLKDRADALRKKYAATNPNPPALEAAKERLAVLQAHLKNGTVPDVRPRQQSKNPVMKAIQQRLADARKELAQSEPSQRARLRKSIGELEAKLEAGQFALPDGAPRPASPEIERLQYERDKLRRKIRAEINELRPKTVWDRIASPLNLSRSFATTFDLPPMFRQGSFITLGNPVRSTRAAVAGLRGMFSDFNARKQLADIEARPNAPLYARAKLYLADMDGSPSAREEAFVGRLADKIPLVRSVIHASERNYTVFLNRLRADTFDAMAASLSRNGEPTMEEAQAIARFINIATGRGDFGRFEQTMSGLAPVFFSPRYVGSRLQLLALQPLSGGSAATKKLIAKEYGKALLGAALVATLAMAAGADLEDDPTDPDFLKLKFGSTRLDFLAGLSQTAVITTRMGYGTAKTIDALARGKTRATKYAQSEAAVAGKFLRSKLSPMASLSLNLATGEDYVGDKVTKTKIAQDLFQPLSFRDIYDAMEEQGAPKGLSMWILSLFGVGMQTYDN